MPQRAYDAAWREKMLDWPTYCVVRHPYERFLSLYRHEAHYARGSKYLWADAFESDDERRAAGQAYEDALLLNASKFEEWAERKLARMEHLLDLAQGASPRQRRHLDKECPRRNASDPVLLFQCLGDDCHSLPQAASVFYPDGTRSCTHVVRYDRLADELERLKAAYGPGVMQDGRAFGCITKKHADMRDFVPLGDARLHAADIPVALRRRIAAAYACDFDLFNFCR